MNHSIERVKAGVAFCRQGARQAFAFDTGGAGDFGDAVRLGDAAHDGKQYVIRRVTKSFLRVRTEGFFRLM